MVHTGADCNKLQPVNADRSLHCHPQRWVSVCAFYNTCNQKDELLLLISGCKQRCTKMKAIKRPTQGLGMTRVMAKLAQF